MVIAYHPEVEPLEPDAATIWRYMKPEHFRSLLENRALFFARGDKLGDDTWEGVQSPKGREVYLRFHKVIAPSSLAETQAAMDRRREFIFVNCWHLNEHESHGMWKLYGTSEKSVAIRSTVGGLGRSLAAANEPVFIGRIHYIDYNSDTFAVSDALTPFFRKRRHFEHECEARAVYWHDPDGGGFALGTSPGSGLYLDTDLSELIDQVVLAPGCSDGSFRYEIERLCEAAGISAAVTNSLLDQPPPN